MLQYRAMRFSGTTLRLPASEYQRPTYSRTISLRLALADSSTQRALFRAGQRRSRSMSQLRDGYLAALSSAGSQTDRSTPCPLRRLTATVAPVLLAWRFASVPTWRD